MLVSSSNPRRTILNPVLSALSYYKTVAVIYITRPTGKTPPPKIFTNPGLFVVRVGEPPETTTERSPPNDSITPARNCKKALRTRSYEKVLDSPL